MELAEQAGPMLHETFAPILYVVPYDEFDDAIAMNNAVAHGLSSAVLRGRPQASWPWHRYLVCM